MKNWTIALFLILTAACTSDSIVIEEPECPDAYTYEAGIRDIINVSCAASGCHVAGGDGTGIYSTYQQMVGFLDDGSFEATIRNGSMPPAGSQQLTDAEMSKILCWLQDGHPEI